MRKKLIWWFIPLLAGVMALASGLSVKAEGGISGTAIDDSISGLKQPT